MALLNGPCGVPTDVAYSGADASATPISDSLVTSVASCSSDHSPVPAGLWGMAMHRVSALVSQTRTATSPGNTRTISARTRPRLVEDGFVGFADHGSEAPHPAQVVLRYQRGRGRLDRVEAGESVTITVDGRPVAHLEPISRRPRWLPREEFVRRVQAHQADPGLAGELRDLAPESTDDLPLR